MNPFEILVYNLTQMGFFGFLLPWLLAFAIFYGLLAKTKILGEDIKVAGVVSLVAAFFVVGYGGPALGLFFTNLFGLATVVLGGILVTVLFISMAGGDISKFADNKAIIALLAGVGIIVFMMVAGGLTGMAVNNEVIAVIFMVIVMGIAVMFITGAGGK